MSQENENGSGKKTYGKPQMTRVKLIAEEAVFAGCKTDSSGNASGGSGRCYSTGPYGGQTNCNELRS
jgi:hypothetical protein